MKLNPYFQIQQIGNSTVLLPSGKTGWRSHGVIQLDNKEEILVARYLLKETSEDDLIIKMAQEIERPKAELQRIVEQAITKLRECGAIIE